MMREAARMHIISQHGLRTTHLRCGQRCDAVATPNCSADFPIAGPVIFSFCVFQDPARGRKGAATSYLVNLLMDSREDLATARPGAHRHRCWRDPGGVGVGGGIGAAGNPHHGGRGQRHTTMKPSWRGLRFMEATPHVAQNGNRRRSRIDARTTRHAGYGVSQVKRKRIEEILWVVEDRGVAARAAPPGPCDRRVDLRLRVSGLQLGADPQSDCGRDVSGKGKRRREDVHHLPIWLSHHAPAVRATVRCCCRTEPLGRVPRRWPLSSSTSAFSQDPARTLPGA